MKNSSKNLALKISTLIVVTACFVVMGSTLIVSVNLKNILTLWGENVQLTIYLDPDISESGRSFIESKLRNSGKVSHVDLVTQEKALGDFRAQLASYAPDLSQDEELLRMIPASLQVRLSQNISSASQSQVLEELAQDVRELEGVEEVSYGQDWVSKYSALVATMELAFKLLGVIVILAALFVISNAIRASIHNRHDEIVVLEMIGATSSMVRKPFLQEGAFLGFVSSAMSLAICFLMYIGIKHLIVTQLNFLQLTEHLQFLSPMFIVSFLVCGTLLGSLASYLCVRRLNDGFAGLQRS